LTSLVSEIMLRSALLMTERILLANPPTTRCGKTTAYAEAALGPVAMPTGAGLC
jgi:hypothetical protein